MKTTLRRYSAGALAVIGFAAAALVAAPGASSVPIDSAGPLTHVEVSPDLNCAVNHEGDSQGEFYGGNACGTLIAFGGVLYGPASIPAGSSASPRTAFTPVSQTAVTGDGSAASPFSTTTVVDGASAIRVTEVDTYVIGKEFYRTQVTVALLGATAPGPVTIYRAGDCYLQNSDLGYGLLDANSVSCRGTDANGAPGLRIEQWIPETPGGHLYESNFNTVWAKIGAQQPFDDTCVCDEHLDNGAGISWTKDLGSTAVTVAHLTNFSPTGSSPVALDTHINAHPAVLSLAAPGAPTVPLNLTATLLAGTTPVVGETLTFKVGGDTICTAVTDSAGLASCGGPLAVVKSVLGFRYAAVYPGTGQYKASVGSGRLVRLLSLVL